MRGTQFFCDAHVLERRYFLERFEPEEIPPYTYPVAIYLIVPEDAKCAHNITQVVCRCSRECGVCEGDPRTFADHPFEHPKVCPKHSTLKELQDEVLKG